MKITAMNIYGFGQLENVIIENLNEFQVFFGENEAGKSTIMTFIHSILFGFPTKQQSELRYEPKHGTKYGGNIRIYFEGQGFAVIERVKGKAAGDVKVVMDNGIIGGEELLKELLESFDKNLFQAIFSFNIHGLQNIHQMKGEELGKYLFSAGTLGTEQLAKAEAALQKELDTRFKPGGKKPELNEKLQELHEVNQELKKAASKNKEYETLAAKKESLLQEMANLNEQLTTLQVNTAKLSEWKRIESSVKQEKWIENELADLEEVQFPVRGMERLEKLNQLILPYKAELNSLAERIEKVKLEIAGLEPNKELLENEPAILMLLDQMPIFDQFKLELGQYEQRLADCEAELSIIKAKLHLPLQDQDFQAINTNMYMKKQVETTAKQSRKLMEAKEELDERYEEEKNALEMIEKEVLLTEGLCLPDQDRLLLEKQVHGNDKRGLEEELKGIKEKIHFQQRSLDQEQAAKSRLKLQFITIELILLGLILYGLLTKQWVLMILGLGGSLAFAVYMLQSLKQAKEKQLVQQLGELREKEKQVSEKLQSAEYLDLSKAAEELKLDNQRREQLQLLKLKLKQQQSQFEKVISKFEEWEIASSQHKEMLLTISRELKIPDNLAAAFLEEAFKQIEKFKEILWERDKLIAKVDKANQQQSQIAEGILEYGKRFLPEKDLDLHKTAFLLRTKLKEELEKSIKNQERKNKLAGMEADWQGKSHELEQLEAEYALLLQSANTDTEQQFYEFGKKAEKRSELLAALDNIRSQLNYSSLSEEERESFLTIHNWDELITAGLDESKRLHARLKELQEEQAKVKYELQVLEEGGVYSDILHHYKQKKFELEETAKEWAVYSLAQNILTATIEKYKNEHLPRMLERAEEFLSFLTNGRYHRIHLHPLGTGFLVEREDRTLFEANELSQATTEQLYVSIRLALATTLYGKYRFPIIIDDSFVNFDIGRTERVIALLKTLEQNQILFFTCHQHLLQFFPKENVLFLEKGAVQIIS
ncbi:AAA family ATPase [Neobacillus sp. SAB-20_R2A]|uniref:ATP-binding protein n=1 Tax=Neobacillus sp. SAB-20_R2A TaxID=3120519 RepID=UPI003C6E7658